MVIDIVRPTIILICLAGIAGWIAFMRVHPECKRHVVGPMCLLSHIIIFEIVIILVVYDVIAIKAANLNQWSQIIWLQTAITTATSSLGLICERRYYVRIKH